MSNLKLTLDSEAVKYLERTSVLVSDFGRYIRFETSISGDLPDRILGLPITITDQIDDPDNGGEVIGVIKGILVKPR